MRGLKRREVVFIEGTSKQRVQIVVQIETDDFLHERLGVAFDSELLLHEMIRIERVDGKLDKHRSRSVRLGYLNSLSEGLGDITNISDGCRVFAERLEKRHLVDVLESAAAFEQVRCCSTFDYYQFLGKLFIFFNLKNWF